MSVAPMVRILGNCDMLGTRTSESKLWEHTVEVMKNALRPFSLEGAGKGK
jgi:hypothetical protein